MIFCNEEVTLKSPKLHAADAESLAHVEITSTASSMRRRRGCVESRDRNPPIEWDVALRNLKMMQLENRERLNGPTQRESSARSATSQRAHLYNPSIIIPQEMSDDCSPVPRNPAPNMRSNQSGRDGSTPQGSWIARNSTLSSMQDKREPPHSNDLANNTGDIAKFASGSLSFKSSTSPLMELFPRSSQTQQALWMENPLLSTPNIETRENQKSASSISSDTARVPTSQKKMAGTGHSVGTRPDPSLNANVNAPEGCSKATHPVRRETAKNRTSVRSENSTPLFEPKPLDPKPQDSAERCVPISARQATLPKPSPERSPALAMKKLELPLASITALMHKPDSVVVSPCSTPSPCNREKKPVAFSPKRERVGQQKGPRARSTLKEGVTPRHVGTTSVGVPRRTPRTRGEGKVKSILSNSLALSSSAGNTVSRVGASDLSEPKTTSVQASRKALADSSRCGGTNLFEFGVANGVLIASSTSNLETARTSKPKLQATQRMTTTSSPVLRRNLPTPSRDNVKGITEERSSASALHVNTTPGDTKQLSTHTSVQRCSKAPLIYRTTTLAEQRRLHSLRIRNEGKTEEEEKSNRSSTVQASGNVGQAEKCPTLREGSHAGAAKQTTRLSTHSMLVFQPPPTSHVAVQEKSLTRTKVAETSREKGKKVSVTLSRVISTPHSNVYLDPHVLSPTQAKHPVTSKTVRSNHDVTCLLAGEPITAGDGEAAQPPRTPHGKTLVPFCVQCGKRHISDTAKFCAFCGHKREVV